MRSALIVLLVTATSAASADSIKLRMGAPVVGDKYTEEKSMVANATVEAKGQKIPMTITEIERKRIEILDVKAGTVTKEKLTFEKKSKVQKMGSKEQGGTTPLEGKSYTLTAGEPFGVDPPADADLVRDAEKHFGKSDHMHQLVGGKEYTKGRPVDLKATDVGGLFGDDAEITKLSLEYIGMDGKNAKFHLLVEATVNKKIPMRIELAGTIIIDPATSDGIAMDMTGTMTSTGGATKIDGTMTIAEHRMN